MDAQCSILVTADGVYRGDKLINLKQISDLALEHCREKGLTSSTQPLKASATGDKLLGNSTAWKRHVLVVMVT
ncbi:acyl-CoA synthetase short chain family member 2 like isoform X1, partial [Tachysurus ichikawai]